MDQRARLKELPKIDELLGRAEVAGCGLPRWAVVEAMRRAVELRRREILAGHDVAAEIDVQAAVGLARELARAPLRRVVNATGVVLHTNLGRAPLAHSALAAVDMAARGYCNLEYELEAGRRGSRHRHLGARVRDLFGAEDAVVVNNNAAAVMIGLAALAGGKQEVVVSRGELVEIGGSFRIPDVMRLSGLRLVEVGTTNKTRLSDYEGAIGPNTALLLKVHRSNFEMVGFTEEVAVAELAALARARGVASMIDLGSGVLLPPAELAALGLPPEPGVWGAVAAGVDLCAFSGDKLLGGPQAGILAGRTSAVEAVRSHPLMRALRPDKLTLAALIATLELYRDGRARAEVPALAMLALTEAELRRRAEAMCVAIGPRPGLEIAARATESAVGGGCLPTARLASWAVALGGARGAPLGAGDIDRQLRAAEIPVVGRIAEDRVLLDLRTVLPLDEPAVHEAVTGLRL